MNPARRSGRIGKAVSDMDKKLGALTAAAAVAGAGAAVVLAKKGAGAKRRRRSPGLKPALRPPIGIRSWGNMRKTARASIIPTATMSLRPAGEAGRGGQYPGSDDAGGKRAGAPVRQEAERKGRGSDRPACTGLRPRHRPGTGGGYRPAGDRRFWQRGCLLILKVCADRKSVCFERERGEGIWSC